MAIKVDCVRDGVSKRTLDDSRSRVCEIVTRDQCCTVATLDVAHERVAEAQVMGLRRTVLRKYLVPGHVAALGGCFESEDEMRLHILPQLSQIP